MIKNIFIGTVLILVMIASAGATVVKVDPASQTIVPGTNFQVNVTVEDVEDLAAPQAVLNFDPSAMQVIDIIESDFLTDGGAYIPIEIMNNALGTALFSYSFMDMADSVSGTGTLVTIHFSTNDAECTYNLNLTAVMLVNVSNKLIPTDVVNGMVIKDNTPPTVEIVSPVGDEWFDSEDVVITFHPWDNKADMLDYWIYVDGDEYASGTAANCSDEVVNLGVLPECDHVINVTVEDKVGKTNSTEVTIHVDLTPPTVEIKSPVDDEWFDSEDVVIIFHPWDNKADMLDYWIYVDGVEYAGGPAANCSDEVVNLGILPECDHVIEVVVKDYAGKADSDNIMIHVDLTPPTVEIKSPVDDEWFDSEDVVITFHPWDNKADILDYWIYVDGVEYASGTAANCSDKVVNLGILPECDRVINVTVEDSVGKTNSTEVTIHVDLTPPAVEIISPEWFDSEDVVITFHPWDNKADMLDYWIYVDGVEVENGTAANCSTNVVDLGTLPECDHVINVTVEDSVGKTNSTEVTIYIDLTPPRVEIISPGDDEWLDSEDVVITFHPWDNKADMLDYWIYVDGDEYASGTAANCSDEVVNLGVIPECDHVINVTVEDSVGKTNSTEVKIHVDLTPPTVEIKSPADDEWLDSEDVDVVITFHPWDNKADMLDYWIYVDGDEYANGTAANCSDEVVNLGTLPECDHVIEVVVKDYAGKAGFDNIVIHVDLTPPIVEITSPEWFDSEDVVVTFHPWDNKADMLDYWIYVDGVEVENGTAANCSETEVNLGILPECDHVINVTVEDRVGKTNSTEVTIYVDLTPPAVEIISPKEGWVNASICIRLNFTAEDPGACPSGIDWIGYSLDGGDNVTIAGNITIGGLGVGSHNIVVYVNDTVGKENSSATVSFTLHPADINGDGEVNVRDLRGLAIAFLSVPGAANWNPCADLNCDGTINVLDLRILANSFMEKYSMEEY